MNTAESIYLFLTNDISFRMRSLALPTDMDKVVSCLNKIKRVKTFVFVFHFLNTFKHPCKSEHII